MPSADQLAEATSIAASVLLMAVKAALFPNPSEASGDIGHLRDELWDATEEAFYAAMGAVATVDPEEAAEEAGRRRTAFREVLRDAALVVFDRWAPAAVRAPEPLRRRVAARHDLRRALDGWTKLGEKILDALGVPLPGGGRAARGARKRTAQEGAT